jgi:N,N-dimethylformamidase
MLQLAGYANRLSVRPGEAIEFKVSSRSSAPYSARLVRVVSADPNPAGPGLREEPVVSSVERTYSSREQPVHLGSFARIEAGRDLGAAGQITFVATIWPTTPGSGRRQGIVSAYDPNVRLGFALAIGEDGSAEALLGATRVKTRIPCGRRAWYRVWATYDGESRMLRVGQVPLARGRPAGPSVTAEMPVDVAPPLPPAGMPWLIGALGGAPVRGHFNGKIEQPMVFEAALSSDQIEAAVSGKETKGLVAAWDFAREMSSIRVIDTGPHSHHGTLVNLPARAMTGSKWSGREMCFRHAPDEYAAIHFHEDDLYDCGWQTDFAWQVPEGTRSGVYAVRLMCGDAEENIPFYVLPPKGKRTADLCVLMSTYTYTVYHNNARVEWANPEWVKMWKDQAAAWGAYPYNPGEHREYGLSTYNFHTDGSGICHASWLRPMLTMRCGYITYPDDKIRGSGLRHFPADTHLIAWLEAKGYSYDIITDEELDYEGIDLLKPYRAVVTGTHPEYHTGAMLDALQAYRDGGGRLVYLGGNGFYWKVARHKEVPGAIEIRRGEGGIRAWAAEPGEYYNAFDGEYGGLWRRNGRPPQSLVGVGFTAQGNFVGSYYRRSEDALSSRAAWILEGVLDEKIGDFGLSGHGAAGFELDRADHRLGTPAHAIVLARSEGHKPEAPWVLVPEEQLTHLVTWALEPVPKLIRADMTFFEAPGNGAVFSTGSITFGGSLPYNNFDNNCSRILQNVLDRFLDPGAIFSLPK